MLNKFLDYLYTYDKSKETIRSYRVQMERFIKFLHPTPLTDVKTSDIMDYISYMKHKEKAAASINLAISAIKTFYMWANKKAELMIENPALEITNIKIPDRSPEFHDLEEMKQIFDCIESHSSNKERDRALIMVLAICGLRNSEVSNLNVSDIEDNKGGFRIIGKGSVEGFVMMSDAVEKAVRECPVHQDSVLT
jgi:Site-specific recombinase XerD